MGRLFYDETAKPANRLRVGCFVKLLCDCCPETYGIVEEIERRDFVRVLYLIHKGRRTGNAAGQTVSCQAGQLKVIDKSEIPNG